MFVSLSYPFKLEKNNLSLQIDLKLFPNFFSYDLLLNKDDLQIEKSDFLLTSPKKALFQEIQYRLFSSPEDNLFDKNVRNISLYHLFKGALLDDTLIALIKNEISQRLANDPRFKIQQIIIQGYEPNDK